MQIAVVLVESRPGTLRGFAIMRRMVTMGLLFALAGCASGRMASRSGVPGYTGGDMSCMVARRGWAI